MSNIEQLNSEQRAIALELLREWDKRPRMRGYYLRRYYQGDAMATFQGILLGTLGGGLFWLLIFWLMGGT